MQRSPWPDCCWHTAYPRSTRIKPARIGSRPCRACSNGCCTRTRWPCRCKAPPACRALQCTGASLRNNFYGVFKVKSLDVGFTIGFSFWWASRVVHGQPARASLLEPAVIAAVDLDQLAQARAPVPRLVDPGRTLLARNPQAGLGHQVPHGFLRKRQTMTFAQFLALGRPT
jgi:hypothetical protein